MCNSEQGEERKSYDAYAGEEEEEEQREKNLLDRGSRKDGEEQRMFLKS